MLAIDCGQLEAKPQPRIMGDFILIEWALGILAVFIGAVLGNMFALGRDLRKERNNARLPLWKWFDSHPCGEGGQLPSDTAASGDKWMKDELLNYKSVASAKEWQRYESHIQAIQKIREPFRYDKYDPRSGIVTRDRAPTEEELRSIGEHWKSIKYLLRHRLFL